MKKLMNWVVLHMLMMRIGLLTTSTGLTSVIRRHADEKFHVCFQWWNIFGLPPPPPLPLTTPSAIPPSRGDSERSVTSDGLRGILPDLIPFFLWGESTASCSLPLTLSPSSSESPLFEELVSSLSSSLGLPDRLEEGVESWVWLCRCVSWYDRKWPAALSPSSPKSLSSVGFVIVSLLLWHIGCTGVDAVESATLATDASKSTDPSDVIDADFDLRPMMSFSCSLVTLSVFSSCCKLSTERGSRVRAFCHTVISTR